MENTKIVAGAFQQEDGSWKIEYAAGYGPQEYAEDLVNMDEWDEGAHAAHTGFRREENPYPKQPKEWDAWNAGYDAEMATFAESIRHNVKEHATPLAGAGVETGMEVHTTGDVADRAASGGCCASPCSPLLDVGSWLLCGGESGC